MHVVLQNVLAPDHLAQVKALLASESFIDGSATSTHIGKKNLQLPVDSQASRVAGDLVLERLAAHDTFQRAVQPRHIIPPMFSRYDVGMEYPDHIDYSIMGGRRTDISITVFLNDPETYDGGELVVDSGPGERRYRLNAGDAIAYPSSTIHHVAQVTRGTRLAAVLWVQSCVRDPAMRQILYDIGEVVHRTGLWRESDVDQLRRSYWNLIRMWADL